MTKLSSEELMHWVAFNNATGFGPKRFSLLCNYFSSLKDAWHASHDELKKAGIDEKTITNFFDQRKTIDPEEKLNAVLSKKINIVTITDKQYPQLLQEIPSAPPLLYYQGVLESPNDSIALAVVGSRKISAYGRQVTEDLTRELCHQDIPIVSGLALGVDTVAHTTCVLNNRRTIAVLGSGLDTIYPSSNSQLAEKIIHTGGLIISEFPLHTPGYRSNFPYRNRIIAGLTVGTMVIEAGERSGSLITAQAALEFNRDVFAVPGSIYHQNTTGPHALLKQGAIVVTNAQDIIHQLSPAERFEQAKSKKIISDNPQEQTIIELLAATPRSIDELIKKTTLDAQTINSILVSMELKGLIRNVHGTTYHLSR